MYATVDPRVSDVSRFDAFSDSELLCRYRFGEDVALEALVRRHSQGLYRFCCHLVSSREDAEDICQEAIARAITRVDTLQTGASFKSWLYSIARNLAMDSFRGRKRLCAMPEDEDSPVMLYDDNPHDRIEISEEHQTVAEALGELAKSHQQVLMMREVEGLSYAAIASRLDVSQSAVETLLFRARRRLKEEYGKRIAVPAVACAGGLRGLLARVGASLGGGTPLAVKLVAGGVLLSTSAIAIPHVVPSAAAALSGGTAKSHGVSVHTHAQPAVQTLVPADRSSRSTQPAARSVLLSPSGTRSTAVSFWYRHALSPRSVNRQTARLGGTTAESRGRGATSMSSARAAAANIAGLQVLALAGQVKVPARTSGSDMPATQTVKQDSTIVNVANSVQASTANRGLPAAGTAGNITGVSSAGHSGQESSPHSPSHGSSRSSASSHGSAAGSPGQTRGAGSPGSGHAQSGANSTVNSPQSATSSVASAASGGAGQVQAATGQAGTQVQNSAAQAGNTAQGTVSSASGQAQSTTSGVQGQVQNTAGQAGGAVQSAVTGAAGQVQSGGNQTGNTTGRAGNDAKSAGGQAGNTVSNTANGAQNTAGQVTNGGGSTSSKGSGGSNGQGATGAVAGATQGAVATATQTAGQASNKGSGAAAGAVSGLPPVSPPGVPKP